MQHQRRICRPSQFRPSDGHILNPVSVVLEVRELVYPLYYPKKTRDIILHH